MDNFNSCCLYANQAIKSIIFFDLLSSKLFIVMKMNLKPKKRTITGKVIDTKAQNKSEGKRKSKPKSKPIKISTTYNKGPWNNEEHLVFEKSLRKYGTTWKAIAKDVGTRTPIQVRTHYQKTKKDKESHEQAKKKSNIYRFLDARREIAIEDGEVPNSKTIESGNKEEFKSKEHIRISENLWNDVKLYAETLRIKLKPIPELDRNMVILLALKSLLNQLENWPKCDQLEVPGDPFKDLNDELVYMEPDLGGEYLYLKDTR